MDVSQQGYSSQPSSPSLHENAANRVLRLTSTAGGHEKEQEDDAENSFNFEIDQNLLIDHSLVIVGEMIGEGSYSYVHEGLYNSRAVAVKAIQPAKTSAVTRDVKEKFQREVLMLSKIQHENIVEFIGATVEPTMMILTELMEGRTLKNFLWDLRPKRLDLKHSISLALDISRAMQYLHVNGIIHRDLKPSNLLLTKDKMRIKLGDFGLAREEAMGGMTSEAGTYKWMAPELIRKEQLRAGEKIFYDHKVDVYSFSIVLWELLTNKNPFTGRGNIAVVYATANNERPSLEGLPEDIAPLLTSCWAGDPNTRPEFKEITAFLTNYLRNLRLAETRPPEIPRIEPSSSHVEEDSVDAGNETNKADDKGKKKKRSFSLGCFTDCLSD